MVFRKLGEKFCRRVKVGKTWVEDFRKKLKNYLKIFKKIRLGKN